MYTLGDLPRIGAMNYPDREAVIFESTRLTYRAFNNRINRFANALIGLGCKKGQRMAVLADNCSKYLEAYFAAAKLGVSVTPLNTRLADEEIAYIVVDCEATVCVVGDGFEAKLKGMKDKFTNIDTWISFDNPIDGFLSYEDLLAGASEAEIDQLEYPVDENEMAVLMYTGGTTGLPKGVMLSHRSFMIAGAVAALSMQSVARVDSTCYVLPLFHVSWWPVLAMFSVCGKVCINRKPDLDAIFKLIQDEKCTHMNLVPTIYGWMVDYPNIEKYNLSSLRLLSYAGSPFPTEVLKKCIKRFGNIFAQAYGSTESAGAPVTMLGVDDHHLEGEMSKYLLSAGKESPCSRIRIVDENDRDLPHGTLGEVCVSGRHVMMGYWKNPRLSEEVLRGGWLHMGDMGYLDEDGYLYLTDRKADMIITGGENVYPKEVEDTLHQHPAVQSCAVVSAPDPRWGEIVQAVVVLKTGQTATAEDVIAHCKARLAGYKCPKAVAFWNSIPTTIVGKIDKKFIKTAFWKGQARTIG